MDSLFIYYSSINYYPSLILCSLNIQIVKEKKKKKKKRPLRVILILSSKVLNLDPYR